MEQPNPLSKYFRQPTLFVSLPSAGRWYNSETITYSNNNNDEQEVAVYPYTAMDEIMMRSPDALLNGVAVTTTLKSCVPAFADPWEILTCDVDKLLVAMRVASYGQKMELNANCPHCNEELTYDANLAVLLDSFKPVEFHALQLSNGITIQFRPITYRLATKINTLRFNNERLSIQLRHEAEANPDTDQSAILEEIVKNSRNITHLSIAFSTEYIQTPDGNKVTKFENILEFVSNIPRELFSQIEKGLTNITKNNKAFDDFEIVCTACHKTFNSPFSFDQSDFFVKGS